MIPEPLPVSFYKDNRAKLAKAIGDDAIAVIDTSAVSYRSDIDLPYWPDPNFYYLTGIDEPEAVLLLIPGQADVNLREMLFLSGTSNHVSTWEGQRLTADQATALSGITGVRPLSSLDQILDVLARKYRTIYLNAPESLAAGPGVPSIKRAHRFKNHYPLHDFKSVLPELARMRAVKHPAEIGRIKQAIAATKIGLEAAWSALAPGVAEYQLAAEFVYAISKNFNARPAWMPIVAAGSNATIVHYQKNVGQAKKGEPLLMDVGAELAYYSADITRTIPVGGHFSPRAQIVFDTVQEAQSQGIKLHRPGISIAEIDKQMQPILWEGLAKLGLAKGSFAEPVLRAYYPHISHHLGLEVHEPIDPKTPLEPGMVVTCEPGLYLREEGIGVRIEDDLLITEEGFVKLSENIPLFPITKAAHS